MRGVAFGFHQQRVAPRPVVILITSFDVLLQRLSYEHIAAEVLKIICSVKRSNILPGDDQDHHPCKSYCYANYIEVTRKGLTAGEW